MRDRVFINYRRSDSKHAASRIYEDVCRSVSRRNVFMDIDNIPAGKEFPLVLQDALERSGVVVAIIGENWLTSLDDNRERRLNDPNDFVRREIAQALANKQITVIPVLLDEARLPSAADLPEDLQPLLTRNAITVRHGTWRKDVAGLITAIRRALWSTILGRYVRIGAGSAAALLFAAMVAFPSWWLPPLVASGTAVRQVYADWQTNSVDAGRVTDRAAWTAAERQNTPAGYQTYIALQPQGAMLQEAERRIRQLNEVIEVENRAQERARIADAALASVTKEKEQKLEEQRRAVAEQERHRLELVRQDDAAYEVAARLNEPATFRVYLDQHPGGSHRDAAQSQLTALEKDARERADVADWARAKSLNRLSDYNEYLRLRPTGQWTGEAQKIVARLAGLSARIVQAKEWRNPTLLRQLHTEAQGTEFEQAAAERVGAIEQADRTDWDKAETARLKAGYQAYLDAWSDGDYRDDARERLTTIGLARQEWQRIRGKKNEAALDAFLSQYGNLEDFNSSALAELVALRRLSNKPLGTGINMLTANELAVLIDGKTVRLSTSGILLSFDSKARLPETLKVRLPYFQTVTKEKYVSEGIFSANIVLDGRQLTISGIGGIQESRVDRTGSLLVLQLLAGDRTEQDLNSKDRLYSTLRIINGPHGLVCVGTEWAYLLAKAPIDFAEHCEVVVPPKP